MTNYGLGGLCEDHNDPYGYNEGTHLTSALTDLVHSGDIMATIMGAIRLMNNLVWTSMSSSSIECSGAFFFELFFFT